MNISIRNVPFVAKEYEVAKTVASILHSEKFADQQGRPVNFRVRLNAGNGIRNNGTGLLTVPNQRIGKRFLNWVRDEPDSALLHEKRMHFSRSQMKLEPDLVQTLIQVPFIDPDLEEVHRWRVAQVDRFLQLGKVQFGVWYKPSPCAPRVFSIEWQRSHKNRRVGLLQIEYHLKQIRLQLGDSMTEEIAYSIVVRFSNLRGIVTGFDYGNPFICFELCTPPILEREWFNRSTTGNNQEDNRKFRERIGSLDDAHAVVAPYAHQLRITLYLSEDLDTFVKLCHIAELRPPKEDVSFDANSGHLLFSRKRLNEVQRLLKTLNWSAAFQIEALLRNGLVNTKDILVDLAEPIRSLCKADPIRASEVLRYFHEALQSPTAQETALECFTRLRARKLPAPIQSSSPGMLTCRHVTFTPTRMTLEGPYVTQSNRVLREFETHQEHFVRVDFRDEDRLQYRWDREVDGASFLQERVGGILKNGFDLGGRHFEFLAYSSSALREHAVWFMNPFEHPQKGYIDSQRIRDSLGDFSGVIKIPSKYAARMAQAFTATDPSVRIFRNQWCEIPDMGRSPYEFTDGVGTISALLGDKIWETLCASRRDLGRFTVKPSAYQIRFLGYKGMVSIDRQLDGIKMCLRPSMNKFKAHDSEDAVIEIARAFDKPGLAYLNRPLIMILEDRGVKKETFLTLQENAVADVRTASDSIAQFRELLNGHHLGISFRLSWLLQKLEQNGLNLQRSQPDPSKQLGSPFLNRTLHFAINHVLRDIKHRARIPISKSWSLVGVADEGPAYQAKGYENVFMLEEGHIFACVQGPDDAEPVWLKGSCVVSRSPAVHPGDVQRVWAIGKPPEGKLCLFQHHVNVVVFPSRGSEQSSRSLASCLGGGDLDGDLFDIFQESTIFPTTHIKPAEYHPVGVFEIDRESNINDVADFVVEYINSDVLGLLATNHLIIADQSKYGTEDARCMKLAQLCSQAVDYPKNGRRVDIQDAPRFLIPYKPDWHQAEVVAPRSIDYYESDRALGHLYRGIQLSAPPLPQPSLAKVPSAPPGIPIRREQVMDPISSALEPIVNRYLQGASGCPLSARVSELFQQYMAELRYICVTHTLSNFSNVRLMEEEIVVGTILAKCSQNRWRSERIYRMRVHAGDLVGRIKDGFFRAERVSIDALRRSLQLGWEAWLFSVRSEGMFAASSFGLIALGVIFEVLEQLAVVS